MDQIPPYYNIKIYIPTILATILQNSEFFTMRLTILLCAVVGSALGAASEPLAQRDLSTVTTVLNNVTTNVKALAEVTKSGNVSIEALLRASNGVADSINSGTASVQATGNLTFVETVHLIGPVHELSTISQSLTKSIGNLKAFVQKKHLCPIVQLQINNINTGAGALITAVNSKVPAAALEISEALSKGISDTLKQIQTEFSPQNCVDGGNVTTTSSSSALQSSPVAAVVSFIAMGALAMFF